jgi:leader peptidase (prepilin peptidase)/N-methyltransferase
MITFVPLIPFAYFGIRLSIIDFKTHRLPNKLVGWFALIEIFTFGSLSWYTDDAARVVAALGVAAITTTAHLMLYLFSRGSLGMGDVKFAFPLGLCIGWYSPDYWLVAIFVSFLIAGLVAVIGLVTKRMTRNSRLAFGPFMLASAFIVLALG